MEKAEILTELIKNRRSIFPASYTDERIDDKLIDNVLESARWAPTHKLTEPWRFTVFCDAGLEKLASYQAELYKEVNTESFDEAKYNKLLKKPLKCSHIIAVGMKRDPEERIPEVEEICSVACAVQNMLLTASAYELGAYWSTGGITYYEGVDEIFDEEGNVRLLGFIFMGKVRDDFWPEGKRTGLDDKVSWVVS